MSFNRETFITELSSKLAIAIATCLETYFRRAFENTNLETLFTRNDDSNVNQPEDPHVEAEEILLGENASTNKKNEENPPEQRARSITNIPNTFQPKDQSSPKKTKKIEISKEPPKLLRPVGRPRIHPKKSPEPLRTVGRTAGTPRIRPLKSLIPRRPVGRPRKNIPETDVSNTYFETDKLTTTIITKGYTVEEPKSNESTPSVSFERHNPEKDISNITATRPRGRLPNYTDSSNIPGPSFKNSLNKSTKFSIKIESDEDPLSKSLNVLGNSVSTRLRSGAKRHFNNENIQTQDKKPQGS